MMLAIHLALCSLISARKKANNWMKSRGRQAKSTRLDFHKKVSSKIKLKKIRRRNYRRISCDKVIASLKELDCVNTK
jgi:hypothetical protein